MNKIRDAKNGQKVVVTGELHTKSGQNVDKALVIVETALIKHAMAEGHDLLNVAGTKTPVHTIRSSGNQEACCHLFRRTIMTAKK